MTIRVGVIGSGFMGRTWSEVAANHAGGTQLVAVAGGKRAAGLADDYQVALETSPDALVARDDVDLVVIASPPAVHRDQSLAAAAAGKHVLVEKPMAQDRNQAATMVDACRSAGVRLSVVSQHRFRDTPSAAMRVIDEGAIGAIRMIRLTGAEVGWWDLAARGDEWKLDPAQQTAWASWSAHGCDLIRWFTACEPVIAYARITNFSGNPPAVGQSAMAQYEMASGALVQVWMTYEMPQPGLASTWEFVIVGSDGILRLDPYGELLLGREGGWELVARQEAFDPLDANDPVRLRAYARQLENLLVAVREGHDPLVSGSEGQRTTAMLAAAEQSARSGHALRLAEDDQWR
jgi:predicted dehydrogenase